MKRILLINTSNRKKNTYKLLSSMESILKNQGFETELITLSDYKINFCNGCEICILKDNCFIKDDVKIIIDKIISCDGLVLGTPVYLNNMSGILKSFIDRTCNWFHRTEVAQKPVIIIANTQGSGLENTINSIEESLIQWGVSICVKIKKKGKEINEPIKLIEIRKFIDLVNNDGKGYCPSFKEVATFNVQKALGENIFPLDKTYWENQGWNKCSYFPIAKLSMTKKIYGNIIYKILKKNIKPIKKL